MPRRLLCYVTLLTSWACAQSPPPQNAAEVASQNASITFQSKVNLVLVPVVVRDKAGKPVGNLTQQDFQLFDRGKPQTITKFSVEKPGGMVIAAIPSLEGSLEKSPDDKPAPGVVAPNHFVAWLFDDVHISFGDLVPAREAADKYLLEHQTDSLRMAVFTTSGQTNVDFTDDTSKLHEALQQLRPRPISRMAMQQCPDVSYYMADRIINKNDTQALNAAAQEAMVCMNLTNFQQALQAVQPVASRMLTDGEHETRIAMDTIKNLVRRMGAMPGQRLILLVSPGFLRLNDQLQDESDIIDRAIRANVTINSLDARGLYTDTPDIAQRTFSIGASIAKQQYARDSARADADVLAELADATGGRFFENSNDIARGINDLSSPPEVYYVLGFSPQNLKLDGNYHNLKVTVKSPPGLSTKARRGYYAPRHLSDADQDAKEEITQALFSREEMHDIPADIHTEFFKASATDARLVVVTRLDVRRLHYRKADGRNNDDVLVVSGLFDHNGNFLQSVSKTVKMHLKDETLAGKLNSGIAIRSDFKVAPGRYVLRLVVRDAEGQMMAAQNGAVEIP